MKAFKISNEQKKWAMTACLLATLSFNMSHLLDAEAGQTDLSSREIAAEKVNEGGVNDSDSTPIGEPEEKPVVVEKTKKSGTKGKVDVDGTDREVRIIKIDDKAAYMVKLCATCSSTVFTSEVSYNDAIKDLNKSMSEAQDLISASLVPKSKKVRTKKEAEVDLSTIAAEDMTDKQKSKRADELLKDIKDSCKVKTRDNSALKCYTRQMKSLFDDTDSQIIFEANEDKVSDFIADNISPRIVSSLSDSNLGDINSGQIKELQSMLPGEFKEARQEIIKASSDAVIQVVTNKQGELDAADQAVKESPTQQNFNKWAQLKTEMFNMTTNPKIKTLVGLQNKQGLDVAVRENDISKQLENDLMKKYNELTAQLFDTNGTARVGSSNSSTGNADVGANANNNYLIPSNNGGTGQLPEGVSTGLPRAALNGNSNPTGRSQLNNRGTNPSNNNGGFAPSANGVAAPSLNRAF